MYATSKFTTWRRNPYLYRRFHPAPKPYNHEERVLKELKLLGMRSYGRLKFATRYLPQVIHRREAIKAIAYGQSPEGSAMLVASDRRAFFLDKKPFFTNLDEVSYDMVSGVNYRRAGLFSTLTLHTRIRDYTIKSLNHRASREFADFIEVHCLERNFKGEKGD